MGLEIYWTVFANKELKSIYKYYRNNAGKIISRNILSKITNSVTILKNFPEIGQVEPDLDDLVPKIRYLITSNYKILYRVVSDKNRVEILDIFDTRQEPGKRFRSI